MKPISPAFALGVGNAGGDLHPFVVIVSYIDTAAHNILDGGTHPLLIVEGFASWGGSYRLQARRFLWLWGRCIENEEWWKLRHWNHIKERGTTTLEAKSAWLVNVILSKHADAMDALPEPNLPTN